MECYAVLHSGRVDYCWIVQLGIAFFRFSIASSVWFRDNVRISRFFKEARYIRPASVIWSPDSWRRRKFSIFDKCFTPSSVIPFSDEANKIRSPLSSLRQDKLLSLMFLLFPMSRFARFARLSNSVRCPKPDPFSSGKKQGYNLQLFKLFQALLAFVSNFGVYV